MDSFSLLKFWKGGAATSSTASGVATPSPPPPPTTTTIITSSTESNSDSEPDAGPFFDLEFAQPSESEDEHVNESTEDDEEEEEEVEEVNLTNNDDVYIRGQIVEINGSDEEEQDTVGTTKSGQFPIPVSLLRSATKLRLLMLGLKKSKTESTSTSKSSQQNNTKKLFTVKLKLKTGENPIISLLTRNTSNLKQNTAAAGEEEKKEKKEMVQRYLRMLYEKAKAAKLKKKGVGVGKKKETAVVHSMPVSNGNSNNGGMNVRSGGGNGGGGGSKRRDDSLLEIQDGIQGAILHCKRSFNSSIAHEELGMEPSVVERDPSTTEETTAATSDGDGRNGVVGT